MPIHGYPGNVITANPTEPSQTSASGVWTTEQQLINQSAGRWPPPYYLISRSLRFNSADSAYLNRTPGSAGNRKTWTWSGWVKRSGLGTDQGLFARSTSGGSIHTGFKFETDNTFKFFSDSGGPYANLNLVTSQVFRDISSWYHIVVVLDTTQATSSNRAKIYVNGAQVTTFSAAVYPNQNDEYQINTTNPHGLGNYFEFSSGWYFNGYMTEVNFIDGQALTPSSFGQTNASTGVWEPIAYTGAYGTNGFYLNFSDNSGTTSTTLGKDYSGNGNNWTPNNFSVTAGAGNDSLVDSPTSYGTDTGVGGEVRGNYCTLNPISIKQSSTGSASNGNLTYTDGTGNGGGYSSTLGMPSGKWYWEFTVSSVGAGTIQAGISTLASNQQLDTTSRVYRSGDGKIYDGTTLSSYGNTYTTGDVIGCALDITNGKVYWSKNGTWQNSGDPVTGTNPAYSSGISGNTWYIYVYCSGSTTLDYNFGQRAFAYTAPSGFKALCTQNLSTPTIGATSTTQANDYFNPVLYTGTGATRSVTGVGFQPDWVWIKERSGAADHGLYDAVRGVQKQIESNRNDTSESTQTTGLTAFNSDGFTVGSLAQLNTNTDTYVAWNWKANGAGGSNTAGTISSTVSANTTSGFSIVTYTGNGSSGATIGHGLGVTPSMIMIRVRNSDQFSWGVYHASVGNTAGLYLNLTNAAATTSVFWNNTSPTSSVFSVGNWGGVNGNTSTYVAYCFAAVAGYSAFGSYTGNGSTDGTFVYTGFRPRYVLIKSSSNVEEWHVHDTARDTYNLAIADLYPNSSSAEVTTSNQLDILSNGFKCRSSNSGTNGSGYTFIYMAFAENPFKYSLAR